TSARFLSSSPHRSANRLDTSSSTCHTRPIFWLSVDDPARQLPAAPPPPPSCDRPPSDPLPLVTPPATYGCCRGSSPPWSKSPYRRSSGAPEGRKPHLQRPFPTRNPTALAPHRTPQSRASRSHPPTPARRPACCNAAPPTSGPGSAHSRSASAESCSASASVPPCDTAGPRTSA